MCINIRAHLLNENGRPMKCILSPRNCRMVKVDVTIEARWILTPNIDWARRSVFAVNVNLGTDEILVYNGGFETQYLSNGDLIAHAVELPPLEDL